LLHHIQSFDVSCRAPPHSADHADSLAHYSLHKGDLVLQVFTDDTPDNRTSTAVQTRDASAGCASVRRDTLTSPDSVVRADKDLGLFSDLVLAIFAHELITGYSWEVASAPEAKRVAAECSSRSFGVLKSYQVLHREAQPGVVPALLQAAGTIGSVLYPRSFTGAAQNTSSTCVPDHCTVVRKFRTSTENIAFLVQTAGRGEGNLLSTVDDDRDSADGEPLEYGDPVGFSVPIETGYGYGGGGSGVGYGGYGGYGMGGGDSGGRSWWQQMQGVGDDERYFSDGL
jgi:hypothetical protein